MVRLGSLKMSLGELLADADFPQLHSVILQVIHEHARSCTRDTRIDQMEMEQLSPGLEPPPCCRHAVLSALLAFQCSSQSTTKFHFSFNFTVSFVAKRLTHISFSV